MKKLIELFSWCSELYRSGKRFLNAPTGPKSKVDVVSWNTNLTPPLSNCKSLSVPFNKAITSHVVVLGEVIRPSAITRFISFVSIFSIKAVSGWARTHVFEKCLKRIAPFQANLNAFIKIVFSDLWPSIFDSCFHARPRFVFWCKNMADGVSMSRLGFTHALCPITPTRNNMSMRDFVTLLNNLFSTLATTFPKGVSAIVGSHKLNRSQTTADCSRYVAYHGLILAGITLLSTLKTGASELTRNITFTDGSRLTAAQLHTLIDGAVINTTFLTGQTLESTLAGDDYFLVYSSTLTGWRKITATAALYQNTALITSASEKTAPTTADYLLLYDAASTSLKKLSIGTLASNITYTLTFTNLATHTTPTNQDKLLIFSDTFGSNRLITLAGLITNLPVLGWGTNSAGTSIQLTNTDALAIMSTIVQSNGLKSNIVSQVTVGQLSNDISSSFSIISTNYPVPNAASVITNLHSFNMLPASLRAVMVCTNADAGYRVGDEVSFETVMLNAGAVNFVGPCSLVSDSNAFYLISDSAYTYVIRHLKTGALTNVNKLNWNVRFRSTFTR